MADFTMMTPWGRAQTHENIGRGIMHVTTAGHGGYFVPEYMLGSIPENRRNFAAAWSGSEQWYEEDCAWAAVALAFPDTFPPEAQESARRTLEVCKIA